VRGGKLVVLSLHLTISNNNDKLICSDNALRTVGKENIILNNGILNSD